MNLTMDTPTEVRVLPTVSMVGNLDIDGIEMGWSSSAQQLRAGSRVVNSTLRDRRTAEKIRSAGLGYDPACPSFKTLPEGRVRHGKRKSQNDVPNKNESALVSTQSAFQTTGSHKLSREMTKRVAWPFAGFQTS
jgi:hypothetical protein